jgi:hypothetical protein
MPGYDPPKAITLLYFLPSFRGSISNPYAAAANLVNVTKSSNACALLKNRSDSTLKSPVG